MELLRKCQPRVCIVSPPCTEFSALTHMWNRKKRSIEVNEQRMAVALLHLRFSMDICRLQHERGAGVVSQT
eukprot:3856377-Amphidinium_carterae.2